MLDRQRTNSLAQMIVLAGATPEVQALLGDPSLCEPDTNTDSQSRVQPRPVFEHFVVRCDEDVVALLMAVRKDIATGLSCFFCDVTNGNPCRENSKNKTARTRMMVCDAHYKKHLGHIGKILPVMGVHGHRRTMEGQWATILTEFWNKLAALIVKCDINVSTGDFNMALCQVPGEFRGRGVFATCVAWYPWTMRNASTTEFA